MTDNDHTSRLPREPDHNCTELTELIVDPTVHVESRAVVVGPTPVGPARCRHVVNEPRARRCMHLPPRVGRGPQRKRAGTEAGRGSRTLDRKRWPGRGC
ncbi:hypothetical protein BHM03_00061992 [Ensete ventricosum]|nr:hypothetical protein BHM03_00061992 [Ensete ventricosum]